MNLSDFFQELQLFSAAESSLTGTAESTHKTIVGHTTLPRMEIKTFRIGFM